MSPKPDKKGFVLNKDALPVLEELGLNSVEEADAFALGKELRRYPEKSIVRFTHAGQTYFLKRYHYSRLSIFLRAALKWNFPVFSGLVEWQRLKQLGELDFRVPEAVAAGVGGTLLYGLSFILLKELPGQSFEVLLQNKESFSLRRQRRLARALGQWVRRFHDHGFCHKDLYLCHLFCTDEDALGMLDCERIEFWPGAVPERWIVKDLAALLYSSKDLVASSVRRSFICGYWPDKESFRGAHSLRRGILRKAERLARKGRKV